MQCLTSTELRALLVTARARRERDWLMMLLAFAHGLRASEVIAITPHDFADGFLKVKRLKGSKGTVQPLFEHPDPLFNLRPALVDYARYSNAKEALFPITRQRFWQIVQEHAQRAAIPKHKAHPHVFKHTIAMQLVGKIAINELQAYLGHKSLSSTGEYTKCDDAQASASVKRVGSHLLES